MIGGFGHLDAQKPETKCWRGSCTMSSELRDTNMRNDVQVIIEAPAQEVVCSRVAGV